MVFGDGGTWAALAFHLCRTQRGWPEAGMSYREVTLRMFLEPVTLWSFLPALFLVGHTV